MPPQTTSRRDRLRQATLGEIHEAVRTLLTTKGSAAVTINAVAREVGMTGPALYHYFAGHDELVGATAAGFCRELTESMLAARDAHAADAHARRLLATCRAMRDWAVAHPAEFGWIFASPLAPPNRQPESARQAAGQRFEQVFLDQVSDVWQARPFPVPELAGLDPSLREQLAAYSDSLERRLPLEAAHVFLSWWIRLYGLLCMEVLNQLDFAFSDLRPVFEECLREMCAALGLDYEPAG
ncbi:TetR/AcrR family transcriptional regulator [Saccharopolyspora sp. NPDC050389]|uniref:TetR/AcrR family transcriptional regulator n=1 Tax=Saccharopolyspora sp. NPDC050389 TaxID=3155516 RepID=UPI003408C032